jgi:hypothetical protein
MAKINWDALGIGASLACAIHCAVFPLVLTSLPVFGINIINNAAFEYFMIFLALCVGCYALMHGYRKHHANVWPLALFGAGMLLLFAKQHWHAYELYILPFAVIFVLSAHFYNFRLCKPHHKKEEAATRIAA